MSPSVVADVLAVARGVRQRFLRTESPADPDDVEQEAALHALEVVVAGRLDSGRNVRGYMYMAAKRETGLASSRWLSKVSISEKAAADARKYQHALTPEEAGLADVAADSAPDRELQNREATQERQTWVIRRARLLDGHARALDPFDRRILQMLFGLGDAPAAEGGVAEVAWCLGITPKRVMSAVYALRRRASGDFGLRRAMRNIIRAEVSE